ncbi:MAG: dicarboxylate/amino acid:cation symporter [Oscillospiraceae bacterium]|nr:dicarboxylate/amino acid:cation symporter [Oscillospiraceae bacterium]
MAEDGSVSVVIKRFYSSAVIELEAKGSRIDELENGNIDTAVHLLEEGSEDSISAVMLKAYGDRLKYIYKDGSNRVRISTQKGEHSAMYAALLALAAAVVVGLLCRSFMPASVNGGLIKFFLSPIKTMFINAMKIIVGPVVFFSIISCFSQFSSLSELGKIGGKVMGLYLLTIVLAVCVGFGMFSLINPGEWEMALEGTMQAANVSVNTDVDTSLIGMLVGIIPSNLFKPFVESNTLQIIFLAVLLGTAVGMIGRYTKILQDYFEACNELFLTVTKIISRFIPLAVFCAVTLMILQTGTDSLLAMLSMAGTDIAALLVMMLLYGFIILLFARINPIKFYRKDWPGMLTSFSLSSSNAAMPTNIQICTESLGVSPKVCGFSIPLGATVNMDGTSIHLAVAAMFLARMYGVEVPASAMVSIVITIVMLSLGTPGVPGASLVCLGILLNQIGVPTEAIGLIMGVDSLLDMFRTTSNTTGDMAVTLVVAKSEGLLDMEIYNSK